VVAIGSSATPGTLQASSPGPEGGFLAYMKAYTDDAGYGALQRLQLVWATLDCASSPAKAPQPIDAPAAVDKLESAHQADPDAADLEEPEEPVAVTVVSGQGSVTEAVETEVDAAGAAEAVAAVEAPAEEPAAAPEVEVTPVETSVAVPPAAEATPAPAAAVDAAPAASGACSPGAACKDGMCTTSSCAINGMGKDVLTMMCFGTNIAPNPILDATTGNPCTNLACKLDKANCTSAGLFGVGGFCSGGAAGPGWRCRAAPLLLFGLASSCCRLWCLRHHATACVPCCMRSYAGAEQPSCGTKHAKPLSCC
jgi:hypothetical protein